MWTRFCLSFGWLHISEKTTIENCNSVGAGAHKVGKVVFGPNLTLTFLASGKREKGKLYILKKFGLSTFKEILQKYVYNSTFMFFNMYLFFLKGYSETLNRANSVLSKLRHFVHSEILRSVYFAIFNSHILRPYKLTLNLKYLFFNRKH